MKTEKQCTTCGKTLPIHMFSPDPRNSDGWRYKCRTCSSVASAMYRASKRKGAGIKNEKLCAKCNQILSLWMYSRTGQNKTSAWCRTCVSESNVRNGKQKTLYRHYRPFEHIAAEVDLPNRLRLDTEHMHMMDVRRELGIQA